MLDEDARTELDCAIDDCTVELERTAFEESRLDESALDESVLCDVLDCATELEYTVPKDITLEDSCAELDERLAEDSFTMTEAPLSLPQEVRATPKAIITPKASVYEIFSIKTPRKYDYPFA